MKKTIVCLFVILSLLFSGLAFAPTGSSQTQNIKIINYSYYFDTAGYLDAVGLVQNVGSNTVNPVYLTGEVYAPNGEPASSSACQVWVSYLTYGQQAPFYMEFPPPQNTNNWLPSYVGNITLTVSTANATNRYQYPDLKVTSSSGEVGTAAMGDNGNLAGAYVVNGVIQNYGTQAATNVTVVGAFFNSTGSVVGVGYTDYLTPQVLAAGATTTFQIAAFDLNQSLVPASLQIHSYQLLLQTTLPILNGTPPPTTSPQGTGSSTSTGSKGSSSSKSGVNSKNSSIDSTIYTALIAAAVIAVAVAVSLLVLRRSKPHQTVKEARKAQKKQSR